MLIIITYSYWNITNSYIVTKHVLPPKIVMLMMLILKFPSPAPVKADKYTV